GRSRTGSKPSRISICPASYSLVDFGAVVAIDESSASRNYTLADSQTRHVRVSVVRRGARIGVMTRPMERSARGEISPAAASLKDISLLPEHEINRALEARSNTKISTYNTTFPLFSAQQ